MRRQSIVISSQLAEIYDNGGSLINLKTLHYRNSKNQSATKRIKHCCFPLISNLENKFRCGTNQQWFIVISAQKYHLIRYKKKSRKNVKRRVGIGLYYFTICISIAIALICINTHVQMIRSVLVGYQLHKYFYVYVIHGLVLMMNYR